MRTHRWIPALTFSLLASAAAVQGQAPAQPQRESLQIYYRFTPAPGAGATVEAALLQHIERRRAEGDPWSWSVFQTAVGEDVGDYYVVTSGKTYADLDAYDAKYGSRGSLYYFSNNLLPAVTDVASMLQIRREDVLRLPENGALTKLFSLTIYHLRPDKVEQFWQAMGEIHKAVVGANHPIRYLFYVPAAGAPGPQVVGVTFHQKWTDRAEPDPNFLAGLLRQTYGADGAAKLADRFWASVESTEHSMLIRRSEDSLK